MTLNRKLQKEIEETEKIIHGLNGINDPLLQTNENKLILYGFKQSLFELVKLMKII